jgi:hypothetical protein
MIARHDLDADSRRLALSDGTGHLWSHRISEGEQTKDRELALVVGSRRA